MAEKICANTVNFRKAVDEFNATVDGSEDPFGMKLFEHKIDKAPLYALYSLAFIHHTMGGIEINENTQVIDTNGNIIPSLFSEGEVTGGVHGSNRLDGNALADIVTFGRIAGQKLME